MDLDDPFMKAAAAYADSQVQWCLLIFGGTIAILVGTSYRHPRGLLRYAYALFIPGWLGLAMAIYHGNSVQRAILAHLYRAIPASTDAAKVAASAKEFAATKVTVTADADAQQWWLYFGLICIAVWLVVFTSCWIIRGSLEVREKER